MKQKSHKNILEVAMAQLILNEPYYANLILNMTRKITADIPTAGVNVTENVNLYINPHFWNWLGDEHGVEAQVDLLKHECHHVLNNHFSRFKELQPDLFEEGKKSIVEKVKTMQEAHVMNQAADYAINEYLPNLPKTFKCFDKEGNAIKHPDKVENEKGEEVDNPDAGKDIEGQPCLVEYLKESVPHAEHKRHTEYYYDLLKQEQEKNGGQGQGNEKVMVIDDHSLWAEGEADAEEIKEKVKGIVNKAKAETEVRNAGNISYEVLELIEKLNRNTKDWRSDLRLFVARTAETRKNSTRKKRNRRYGTLYAGFKRYPKMHLAVAIDTSGSVHTEELEQGMAEIAKIYETGVKITVVEFDAEVNQVYEFNPKKPTEIKGRGGTCFNPALEKCDELDVDGVICFTDGGCWESENELHKPKFPVMWALYGDYSMNCSWGYRTQIKINRSK